MAEALEAGFDLGALALLGVALAGLLLVKGLVEAVAGIFDFSLFGYRPLHRIAVELENGAIAALDDAIKSVEATAAKFFSGLIDAFGMLIAVPLLLGLGVKAALEYLWSSALKPTIHAIVDPVRTIAARAASRVTDLEGVVASNVAASERYAREHATAALHDAEAYVEARLATALHSIGGEIGAGVSSAERYADEAVSKLRAAEDQAVSAALALAVDAKVAGLAAATAAAAEAERVAGAALSTAETELAGEIAAAKAVSAAAVAELEGVLVNVGDDLHAIEGALGAVGVGALLASIPALATLVHAIATEAGLENPECRGKVKGICSTPSSSWAGLLAGLAAVGAGFGLAELAELANELVRGMAPVVRELVE